MIRYLACATCMGGSSVLSARVIACWMAVVLKGVRRAHPILCTRYDLTRIRSSMGEESLGAELEMYLTAFGAWPPSASLEALVMGYSGAIDHGFGQSQCFTTITTVWICSKHSGQIPSSSSNLLSIMR